MQRPDAAGLGIAGDAPGAVITRDAFSRPGFSAVGFVNAALGGAAAAAVAAAHEGDSSAPPSPPSQPSLEAALSNALVRLQLLAQECSDRSDGHMSRVLAALPRARRELRSGVGEVDALSAQLRALTDGGGAAEGSTAAATTKPTTAGAGSSGGGGASYIATLEALDAARGRLAGAARLLSLAGSWDRLLREGDNDPALAALLSGGSGGGAGTQPPPPAAAVGDASSSMASPPSSSLARLREHLAALEACAADLATLPGAPSRAATVAAARSGFTSSALPVLSGESAAVTGRTPPGCIGASGG
jgi:hypothetical protein